MRSGRRRAVGGLSSGRRERKEGEEVEEGAGEAFIFLRRERLSL